MTASSACLSLLSLQIWRRPPLRRTGTDIRPDLPFVSLVTTGMLAVALVLGVLVPEINYFALLLLFLTRPIESRWEPTELADPAHLSARGHAGPACVTVHDERRASEGEDDGAQDDDGHEHRGERQIDRYRAHSHRP